jgi:hypothetical protein
LDTEFNGFGGELISMALVADKGDWVWYAAKQLCNPLRPSYDAWVAENVLPKLATSQLPPKMFRASFAEFITFFDRPEIICDWHTDVIHFCKLLEGDSFEESIPFEGKFVIIQTPPGEPKPEIPHNALSDAKALRDWHLAQSVSS